MLPVKGIKLMIISVLLASLLMPFTVFANSQNTIIVPTWDSSTTQNQWDTHLTVENYCEGTTAATNSCKLMFTVDSNYYGYIYFDGYVGNTKWIDFQMVFIADGYGEYNYNLWSNGQISINKVNIAIVNLVQPNSSVDLTQIIQLLTAIEQDTSSIDILVNQTKTQIINVLNQLVISNGYLETLTKLRQWNIPIESFGITNSFLIHNIEMIDIYTNNYFSYPIFNYKLNDVIDLNNSVGGDYILIMAVDRNIQNISGFNLYFSFNKQVTVKSLDILFYQSFIPRSNTTVIKAIINIPTSGFLQMTNIYQDLKVIPIYWNNSANKNISTDFALIYGLSNSLLDNLNTIANGTTQSNSASSDLQSTTSDFQTSANQYYSIENTYNNNMNTQLQNIDTNTGLSGFGGNFLTSANWVRVQFNNLTNGNPFGSLVTYGLTLGLALLLLGKVFL